MLSSSLVAAAAAAALMSAVPVAGYPQRTYSVHFVNGTHILVPSSGSARSVLISSSGDGDIVGYTRSLLPTANVQGSDGDFSDGYAETLVSGDAKGTIACSAHPYPAVGATPTLAANQYSSATVIQTPWPITNKTGGSPTAASIASLAYGPPVPTPVWQTDCEHSSAEIINGLHHLLGLLTDNITAISNHTFTVTVTLPPSTPTSMSAPSGSPGEPSNATSDDSIPSWLRWLFRDTKIFYYIAGIACDSAAGVWYAVQAGRYIWRIVGAGWPWLRAGFLLLRALIH